MRVPSLAHARTPEHFRRQREALGLTRLSCAALLDVGVSTITRYENGRLDAPSWRSEQALWTRLLTLGTVRRRCWPVPRF